MSCRKCETICVDCEWNEICYINESKNKKLICWINEQDKILSFHQEEFVQNEFTDRDELDVSCWQCLEYIGCSNKNCKVVYESAI